MLTKEHLEEYSAIKAELRSIERQLEALESDVYGVKAVAASAAPRLRKRRAATGDFSDLLIKLLDLKADYVKKWDTLIDLRAEIEKEVEKLPYAYRALIRAKYIDGLTWEETADTVGYSVRQVYRICKDVFK